MYHVPTSMRCLAWQHVGLATGCAAPYTHWKQTVFYLLDTFPVCEGEEVFCQICY